MALAEVGDGNEDRGLCQNSPLLPQQVCKTQDKGAHAQLPPRVIFFAPFSSVPFSLPLLLFCTNRPQARVRDVKPWPFGP